MLTGYYLWKKIKMRFKMQRTHTHSAGNFYINDKPTGAVVGQQPLVGVGPQEQMTKQDQNSIYSVDIY